MAGDWIKFEHATPGKPEVAMLANLLCISRNECVGMLIDFWIWWDRNAGDDLVVRMLSGKRPDSVRPMTGKCLDDIMRCDGFSAAMTTVGWVEIDEENGFVRMPNCGEHNGKTAKNRALDNRRKAESRSGQEPDKTRTREEKRRVLKQKNVLQNPDIDARDQPHNALEKKTNGKTERWDASETGIDAKGRELGVFAKPQETYFEYKRRLWGIINERGRGSH